ncbi:MAG: multidrug ABC transporter ATP-binding protein [Acidobacteria bacterium]|nr:MAG: multidrug ABC transporter ATP-binding protein [Acidobacteriota bacterium]
MNAVSSRLWAYVRSYVGVLLVSLVFVAIVGVLEAATPFLIGLVFDTLLRASAAPILIIPLINTRFSVAAVDGGTVLILLVAVTIVKAAAEYSSVNMISYLGQAVVRDLRNDVFEKIICQPLRFFHFNPTGELISRVSADVERIQTAASETLAEFLKQGAILIFLLVAIFAIDWKLAAASIVLAPLVFYPAVWFGKKLRLLSKSNQQEMAEMANILYETITGNRIVKAFSMEQAETSKFRKLTQRIFTLNLRQKMTHTLSSPLMEVVGILVIAGFLLYARAQIASQRMTAGLFVAFVIALIKLYDPVRRMSGINNSFQQAFGASGRVFEILCIAAEQDTGHEVVRGFTDCIVFDNVFFGYDTDESVLNGISFTVRRGEVVAIVGPSGAGKTTLVNLLPRFYDVTAGRILIDGKNIRDLKLDSLRNRIAMVTQDVILFNDTVRANIAYGDPTAGDDAVRSAAKAALVDDFVSDYGARIGERGLRLSGGERQRVSIARALLKNAPILILDEATSSLDTESEALVQQALQNLMEGRTTIVIAHRLSTVRRADRILVLADGRIRESGTHEELVLRRGLYWKLYSLQFQDVNS